MIVLVGGLVRNLSLSMENMYFRPEWTCGRYDKKSHSAIYYNLISGFVYSYIDFSADVIGLILEAGRNGQFSISQIAETTGIAEESLQPFIDELANQGLVTTCRPSTEMRVGYRRYCANWRKGNIQSEQLSTKEKLPVEFATAEMDYTQRAGGITSAMFELTYRCPEKCVHCYNPGATRNDNEVSHRGDREELTLEDYKRIIDQLYDEGLVKVCLSGGDPFSHKYVWDILDYLYQKEIAVDIFTNGQSITDKIDRLVSFYPRLIGVSIYSGSPEEHDYITRVKGSWQKSMDVVKQVSEYGVPMNLKCCIMRPNVKHYHEVADLCKQYGARPQFEVNVTDSVEGDTCVSKYLRLTPELLEIVLRDNNIKLYVGPEAPNFGGQAKLMDYNGCGSADNTFCITPEGNMIPCCAFHLSFGNLKKNSVEEILQSEELARWRNTTLAQYEECGQHDYCAYCNLCPGCNYSEHGDYKKAAENCCYLAKVRFNLAQKMMEGYDPLDKKHLP